MQKRVRDKWSMSKDRRKRMRKETPLLISGELPYYEF